MRLLFELDCGVQCVWGSWKVELGGAALSPQHPWQAGYESFFLGSSGIQDQERNSWSTSSLGFQTHPPCALTSGGQRSPDSKREQDHVSHWEEGHVLGDHPESSAALGVSIQCFPESGRQAGTREEEQHPHGWSCLESGLSHIQLI